jgi:hypothetical protein
MSIARKPLARIAATAGAVSVFALGAALPAEAAVRPLTSGGGCYTNTVGSISVEACISVSGSTILPDAYILRNTGCTQATLFAYDWTQHTATSWSISCADGHHGPFGITGTKGHTYFSYITIGTAASDGAAQSQSPDLYYN